jgi:hypothetical protein
VAHSWARELQLRRWALGAGVRAGCDDEEGAWAGWLLAMAGGWRLLPPVSGKLGCASFNPAASSQL